ncbi:MAG: hypothetical protein P1P87_00535 [Trueperaceae bacterium]|nr:hypothetical protein [Trueperaceae bacterium]
MRAERLDQVFVARRGWRVELRLVLEAVTSARTRTTLLAPVADPLEAVRWAARALAREGEVRDVSRLRLRVERGGHLVDDPALAAALVTAFRERAATEEDG